MWSIGNLKKRGKTAFKRNYWKCVLVGLLLTMISGGIGAASGAASGGSTGASIGQQIENSQGNDSFDYDASEFGLDEFGIEGEIENEIAGGAKVAAIAAIVSFFAILFVIIMAVAIVTDVFIINPLEMGTQRFFLINQQNNAEVKEVCFAFDRNFKNHAKILFFRDLYTFLWSLLFIIPGIVKAYEYRMIPYILSDDPEISMEEAFARSKYLMKGEKLHAFLLDLSFIGWWILSIFTCGILLTFYVLPYEMSTEATLYEALRYLKLQDQGAAPETVPAEAPAAAPAETSSESEENNW